MADTKISGATADTAPLTTDELPMNSGGASKRITLANLAKAMPGYVFDYAQITSSATSTATTAATATTVITGNAVTYDGSTIVSLEVQACGFEILDGSGQANIDIWDGATDLGTVGMVYSVTGGQTIVPLHGARRYTPSAGSHTFTARIFVGASTGKIYAGTGAAGALTPAFLRVVKVG